MELYGNITVVCMETYDRHRTHSCMHVIARKFHELGCDKRCKTSNSKESIVPDSENFPALFFQNCSIHAAFQVTVFIQALSRK